MKQTYIIPEIEVVAFESEILMNVTSGEQIVISVGEGFGDGEDLANQRRGSWGNLWE